MATISLYRPLEVTKALFEGDIDTGYIVENSNKYYLPLTINNFTAPDLALTVISGVVGQSKLTAVAPAEGLPGKFDEVRVGDVISAVSSGTLTAKSQLTRTCYTVKDLNYVIYADTLNSSTLGVKAGDAVSGTGIPSNTVVDKIDYQTRRIFLSDVCTANGSVDLTITPLIRVTAVRTSTAIANANEIDIDTTVATTITNANVTVTIGANEAVFAVLRLEPLDNTTGSRANFTVSVAYLDGTGVIGSASGLNNVNILTLGYITLGTFGFDMDSFLVKARLPKPTSV